MLLLCDGHTPKPMKSLLIIVALLAVPGVSHAKEVSQEFSVEGWTCAGCAKKTAKVVRVMKGVKKAETNLDKKVLVVAFDDAVVQAADIEKAIKTGKPGCD